MKDIIEKAKRIKHLEAIEKALKDKIKEVQHLVKDAEIEKMYLKDDIILYLESQGVNKIQDENISVTMSDSPFSVVFTDESIIPIEYKKEKTIIDIDKKKLIDDRDNINIEGINFIQTKRLMIKA